MKITNLTDKKQKFVVREIVGEFKPFDLFIEPKASTEIDGFVIVNPDKYKGILNFGSDIAPIKAVEKKVETPAPAPAPVVEEKKEEKVEPEVKEEEKAEEFICDECGAEFASARALAAHKNKAHAQ